MATDGVTQACRAAIANAVTAAGVTCRNYQSWYVYMGSMATLGAARWELTESPDQRYGVRAIVFPLRLYQVIAGGVEQDLA